MHDPERLAFTSHALRRLDDRSIPESVARLAVAIGRPQADLKTAGAYRYHIDPDAVRLRPDLAPYLSLIVVVDEHRVVTVMYDDGAYPVHRLLKCLAQGVSQAKAMRIAFGKSRERRRAC